LSIALTKKQPWLASSVQVIALIVVDSGRDLADSLQGGSHWSHQFDAVRPRRSIP
jgi:hypothetical protein